MKKPRTKKPKAEKIPPPPAKRVVVLLDDVPGLNDHLASVRAEIAQLRELPFIECPVSLCSQQAEQFRPRHRLLLIIAGNPIVCGGAVGTEHVTQFLWMVSPRFSVDPAAAAAFAAHTQIEDGEVGACLAEIQGYIDDAFMDANHGSGGEEARAGLTASLCHAFFRAYGWERERVMDTPFADLFQRLRLITVDAYRAAGKDAPLVFSRVGPARLKYISDWEAGIIP